VCVCVCVSYIPPSGLFAVGACAGDPAEPLALPALHFHFLLADLHAQVVQVAGVQGGVPAQLPLFRVRLLLYLDA